MAREIPLSRGLVTLVDDCDYEALSCWSWSASTSGYAVRARRKADGPGSSIIFMHRVIAAAPHAKVVDHINCEKRDNRRANLRVCTPRENSRNVRLLSRNTIGFKGVVRLPGEGRYKAVIRADGGFTCSRIFSTAIGAALAYDSMARELHGEFAAPNFPDMVIAWPWRRDTGTTIHLGRRKHPDSGRGIRRVQRPDLADTLLREMALARAGDLDVEALISRARDAVYGPIISREAA